MKAPSVTYLAETIEVDVAHWHELDRLSRDADPDGQVALNRFLDRYGCVVRRARTRNLVTTAGKNDLGAKYFQGASYTAAWYVGLKGAGTPVVGDTMPSHASWTEVTAYTQSTRPLLQLGAWSSGAANNSANRAIFTANASTTIHGYFLTNTSGKGGATGILYSVANFSASRSLTSGQAERVQVNLSFA